MPSYRIGFGSDFVLENRKVGVGSESPTEELSVSGTISYKDANWKTGVSTLSRYIGFNKFQQSGDITFSDSEYSSSGDIIVGVGETFTVSAGSTIDVGSFNSISVKNHFSPPTGGVEERLEKPVEGTVRFNKDLNTLEFYNGIEWRQFTVNGASGRGYFGPSPSAPSGGQVPNAIMHSLSMVNYSGLTEWGSLTVGAYAQNSAVSSSTRMCFAGGTIYANPWAVINNIDYKALASSGDTADFGDLSTGRRALTALSSSTRGIFIGGVTPTTQNVMDFVEIASTGNATDFGDCMTAGRYSQSGCSSSTRGLCVHGNPNNRDYIEVLNIASKGNTTKFGNRLFQGGYTTGVCNGVRALFGGGYQMSPLSGGGRAAIGKVLVASDGNETYFGDLTEKKYYSIGLASKTRGLFAGGAPGSSGIDSVSFETEGHAVRFGDLDRQRWSTNGSTDCHGGLGGY